MTDDFLPPLSTQYSIYGSLVTHVSCYMLTNKWMMVSSRVRKHVPLYQLQITFISPISPLYHLYTTYILPIYIYHLSPISPLYHLYVTYITSRSHIPPILHISPLYHLYIIFISPLLPTYHLYHLYINYYMFQCKSEQMDLYYYKLTCLY